MKLEDFSDPDQELLWAAKHAKMTRVLVNAYHSSKPVVIAVGLERGYLDCDHHITKVVDIVDIFEGITE